MIANDGRYPEAVRRTNRVSYKTRERNPARGQRARGQRKKEKRTSSRKSTSSRKTSSKVKHDAPRLEALLQLLLLDPSEHAAGEKQLAQAA